MKIEERGFDLWPQVLEERERDRLLGEEAGLGEKKRVLLYELREMIMKD